MKREYIIYKLSESIKSTSHIEADLFVKYNVKRGLRNEDHSGVLVGLTQIGNVVGYERQPEGQMKAIPGKLIYRGISVEDLVRGIQAEKRFGFEETVFLLLSGYLPDREELTAFCSLIHDFMPLHHKTKMNILDMEGQNVMNILARSVLGMYTFDDNPDDTSRDNLMRAVDRSDREVSHDHRLCVQHRASQQSGALAAYPLSEGGAFDSGEFPLYAQGQLYGARRAHARSGADVACRARRRQQLDVHGPRDQFVGNRYLFVDRGGNRIAQGTASRAEPIWPSSTSSSISRRTYATGPARKRSIPI